MISYPFFKVSRLNLFFKENKISLNKRLGQNFLIDVQVLEIFKNTFYKLNIKEIEYIVEIGPGLGFLTHFIYNLDKKVILFEIDKFFCSYLQENYPKAILYKGCFMKNYHYLKNKKIFIFANLPYYLTSKILIASLKMNSCLKGGFFLVQKEFAQKLLSYKSSVSIFLNAYGNFKILRVIPKNSFYPKPKIDSIILFYEFCPKLNRPLEFDVLEAICKIFFWGKRKKIKTCLKKAPFLSDLDNFDFREKIRNLQTISFEKRADEISPEIYYDLAKRICV